VIHNIIVSGDEAKTLSAENSGKPLGGRGSRPKPRWGAHSAPGPPIAGVIGLAAYAPPEEPHPRSRPASIFGPSGLIRPVTYVGA